MRDVKNKLHYYMNGWLIVDKKAGMTSMDVSREIIKALRKNHIHGLRDLSDISMNFASADGELLSFDAIHENNENNAADLRVQNAESSSDNIHTLSEQYSLGNKQNNLNIDKEYMEQTRHTCNVIDGKPDSMCIDQTKIDTNINPTQKQEQIHTNNTNEQQPAHCRHKYKMGHAGTLDPFATGLLPIAIGEATKLISLFMHIKKAYVFKMRFGQKRDTGDVTGKVIATADVNPEQITLEKLNHVITRFIGNIKQTPHKMSAMKVDGKRAYDLFRDNVDFELSERDIVIDEIRILDFSKRNHVQNNESSIHTCTEQSLQHDNNVNADMQLKIMHTQNSEISMHHNLQNNAINEVDTDKLNGYTSVYYAADTHSNDCIEATLYVKCGKGTYVRSLCEDIASALNTYAYVETLDRVEYGNIKLNRQAVRVTVQSMMRSADEIEHDANSTCANATYTSPVLDTSVCAQWFDNIEVDEAEADVLRHGCYVKKAHYHDIEACVVLNNNQVVCIAKCEKGMLKPLRVLKLDEAV